MEQSITEFLVQMAQNYPWLAVVLTIMSVSRAIAKPIYAVIEAYVKATPNKKDDEAWGAFLKSKVYWVIDYIFSIKVKPKE